MNKQFSILFLGDIVGRPGRQFVKSMLPKLRKQYSPSVVVANGENAAGGVGIDPGCAAELFDAGIDVITTGNHVWKGAGIEAFLDKNTHRIVRPANFPAGSPGVGFLTYTSAGGDKLGVLNIQGRVFMPDLVDCPFRAADSVLEKHLAGCDYIFVDFHGEATSEKVAMGYHLDGRVTAVVGTHTHVQTADERLLPGGTAYITDVGMCGPAVSVLGVRTDNVLERFLTSRPIRFNVAKGDCVLSGVVIECEEKRPVKISRILEYSAPATSLETAE